MITIASVVEGDGEVSALPELIRRVAYHHGFFDVLATKPHHLPRGRFLDPREFGRAVELQSLRVESRGGVVALIDADDDCAVELVKRIRTSYDGHRPFALVAAVREYESIFLAHYGVAGAEVEARRDAKGPLKPFHGPYRETVHQAKLSAVLDLDRARECRWFRKFEKELLAILRG